MNDDDILEILDLRALELLRLERRRIVALAAELLGRAIEAAPRDPANIDPNGETRTATRLI